MKFLLRLLSIFFDVRAASRGTRPFAARQARKLAYRQVRKIR